MDETYKNRQSKTNSTEIKELKSNLAKIIKSKGKDHFVKVIDKWSKPFLKGKPEVEGLDYLGCNPYKDESGMINVEKILPGRLLYYIFEKGFEPTGLIKDILIAALYAYLNMGVVYPTKNFKDEIKRASFDVLAASIEDYYPENAYYFLDITGGQEPSETEPETARGKLWRIRAWLKELIKEAYRLAMRSFFDSAMHK